MNISDLNQELSEAAKAGDVARIESALDRRASCSGDLRTEKLGLLALACEGDHLDAVKLLLARGANVNLEGGSLGMAPISTAAGNGNEAIVRVLLEHGAEINRRESFHGNWEVSPLNQACGAGHLAIARILIENGAKVSGGGRETLLTYVVEFQAPGKIEVAEYLLSLGSEIWDAEHIDMGLIQACESGWPEMIELFLRHGANIPATYTRGEEGDVSTPLLAAAISGCGKSVRLLLSKGADLNQSGKSGVSVLRRLVDLPKKNAKMASGALILMEEMGFNPFMRIGVKSLLGHFSGCLDPQALEIIRDAQRRFRSEVMAESIDSAMGGVDDHGDLGYSSTEPSL